MHYGFSKREDIHYNIHVYKKNHPEIELNILFRNHLRKNENDKNDYKTLKIEILKNENSSEKNNSSFSNYTLLKGFFIKSILKK